MSPAPNAPRKKIVCIGFDVQHKDFGSLTGAVEDARRWGSFAGERLDFEVRLVTHQDMPRAGAGQGMNLLNLLDEEVSVLGPGDLFGLFLATHGKEIKFKDGQRERIFTLPITSNAVIDDYVNNPVSQRFKTGGLFVTLSQLEEVTSRPGLQRFFVLDACRSVVDLSLPTTNRKGEREAFDGETIDRAMQLRISSRDKALLSPLTTVNSCSDGQVAKELKHERGGAFTLSAIKVMRDRHLARKPLRFDEPYIADVEAVMRAEAERLDAQLDGQRPSVIGMGVELWSMSESQRLQLDRLLAAFEAQLQANVLEAPGGACARDTLSQIRQLDIPQKDKDALQERLDRAIEDDRHRRHLANDEGLLARARASDTIDDWNAVLYRARLDASREEGSQALQRLRRKAEDGEAWRTALAIRSLAAIDRYLEKFGPQALHHADALDLKARLKREEDDFAEREAWRQAQQTNTKEAYRQFIGGWPASLWLSEASRRLKELEGDDEATQAEARAWAGLHCTAPLPATEQGFAERLSALQAYRTSFPYSHRAWAEYQAQLDQGLRRLRQRVADQAAEEAQRRRQQELADWQAAEGANTTAAYGRYHTAWPEGEHAVEALARISELKCQAEAAAAAEEARRHEEAAFVRLQSLRPTTTSQLEAAIAEGDAFTGRDFRFSTHAGTVLGLGRAWNEALLRLTRQELTDWQVAEAARTIAAYERYRSTWPEGEHAAEASARIAEIQGRVEAAAAAEDARRREEVAFARLQSLQPKTAAELEAAIVEANSFTGRDFRFSTHAAAVLGLGRAWDAELRRLTQQRQELQERAEWRTLEVKPRPTSMAQAQAQLEQVRRHLRTWGVGPTSDQAKQQLSYLEGLVHELEKPSDPPKTPSARLLGIGAVALGLTGAVGWLFHQAQVPPEPGSSPPVVARQTPPAPLSVKPAAALMAAPPLPQAARDVKPLVWPTLSPQAVLSTLAAATNAKLGALSPGDLETVQAAWRARPEPSLMAADDLLISAGASALGWPRQPVDPGQAMRLYIAWLTRHGATASAELKHAVESIITRLLAVKPSAGVPPTDWAQVIQAMGASQLSAQSLPADYWRGAIQYCLLNPPQPAAAKASFTAAARQQGASGADEVASYASVSTAMLDNYLNIGKTCAQMNAEYGAR